MEEADLLLLALVYLAAGVLSVPLAHRLGLGSVLGYLIAGAVIGPFALGLVGDQTSVMKFAGFGVVIMLFLIGLEVRPSLLWRMRGLFFGLGGAQVALTGSVLAGIGFLLGLDWRTAVAGGFILSLSSTAIVLQTLEELKLRQTASGQAAFGILLFQDLSIIPMFAVLPLLAVSNAGMAPPDHGLLDGLPAWTHTLAAFFAVALVVLTGRYFTRPAFLFIANTRSREIFTATALLLVVAVALLMEAVGLSAGLGAFLAGVVLADSEFRRELEADIEPFRGLLLGLFFISVGASLDLALAAARPLLLAGLVLGLMAVKAIVLAVTARIAGFKWRIAGQFSVALAQGGEFAFVLLGACVAGGIIARENAAIATAVVAISMGLTPLALTAYRRLAQPAALPPGPEPENDAFDAHPEVIVAGFGRFGQIASRLLIVNGFRTVVLEASSEQVELVRRFGRPVYYGDATRLDLLRAAGAAEAKLLIVAIDGRDEAEDLVAMARENFPNLRILARAYDRRHAYRLLDKGAHYVERETFESGLAMGEEALHSLGFTSMQAARAARLFRKHDAKVFQDLAEVWGDDERFIIASRETSERMNELLAADIQSMLKEGEERDEKQA